MSTFTRREEARYLKTLIEDRQAQRLYPVSVEHWKRSDEITRFYLLTRACDLAYYGKRLADESFPSTTSAQGKALVSLLVFLLKKREARRRQEALQKQDAQKFLEIKKEGSHWVEVIPTTPLPKLFPRVLSSSGREALKEACVKSLLQEPGLGNVVTVITEFVEFCGLPSQPENHSFVPTGQYIERQYNTRQYTDMKAEMVWELSYLPPYTAYAKVIKEETPGQTVLKRKIQTLDLPPPVADDDALKATLINRSYARYYQERGRIEEDIFQKEKERLKASLEAPPGDTQVKRPLPGAKVQKTHRALILHERSPRTNDAPPPSD